MACRGVEKADKLIDGMRDDEKCSWGRWYQASGYLLVPIGPFALPASFLTPYQLFFPELFSPPMMY